MAWRPPKSATGVAPRANQPARAAQPADSAEGPPQGVSPVYLCTFDRYVVSPTAQRNVSMVHFAGG